MVDRSAAAKFELLRGIYDLARGQREALERDDLGVIVAKVKAVGPDNYGMDFALPENAFRFKRWIRERSSAR